MLASVRHNFQLVSGLFAKDPQNPYYRSFELVWSFARHYRWRISSIFFLNFLSALFESNSLTLLVLALTSLLGGDMSDAASRFGALGDLFLQVQRSMSPTAFFFVLAGIAIGSQVLKSGITLASGLSSSYLNSALSESSKVMVYERLNSIPYAQLMKYKLGDVANYIGYTNTIGRMITLVNQTLNLIFNMAIYVGVLFWLSVPMTLATFAVFGLIGIGLFVITQRIHHYEQISFENRKRFNQQIFENVQALRLLTIMNQNHRTIEATRELANLEREVHYRGNALRLLISPILEITALLSVTAFIVIGYFFAGGLNADTLPGIIVFMLALWRIVPRLAQFNGIITSFASYQLHLVELADMLEITSQLQAPRSLAPFHGLHDRIRYEDVELQYIVGENKALNGVTFDIERGTTVALVGESGAGKSTTADVLLGLFEPTYGRILVDGVDLRDLSLSDWRDHISVVDQEPFLFHRSVLYNIQVSRPDATFDDVVEAARLANAHNFIVQLAEGYETVIGERGYRLSGGQRQRLSLARAILRNTEIMILDEATSNLDSESEKLIQDSLQKIQHERTMLIIAHRLSTIMKADKIIVLEKGRIVEQGTHTSLIAQRGRYANFWRLQSELQAI